MNVEPLAEDLKSASGSDSVDGNEDAEEEEDGAHVDAREHVGHALLRAAVVTSVGEVAVEYFRYGP